MFGKLIANLRAFWERVQPGFWRRMKPSYRAATAITVLVAASTLSISKALVTRT